MSKQKNDWLAIHLHGENINTRIVDIRKLRIIREMAGLELLIQKGIMVELAFNRLKELTEKMK